MKPNKSKQAQRKTEFVLDAAKKADVAKYQIDSNKKLKVADFLGKIMLVSGIAAAVSYFLINAAINAWSISYVSGNPSTPYGVVIVFSLLMLGLGAGIFGITHAIVKTVSGKEITTRINESLEMTGLDLRYTYHDTKTRRKNIITIPVDKVGIGYEPKSRRLEFSGEMKVNQIRQEKEGRKTSSSTQNEHVLYDYFEPSLHLILQKQGVNMAEIVAAEKRGE